jgi:drug/metabolite transporter (DMT)-like permease
MALPLGAPSVSDWSIVVYLGVIQIALAYLLVTRGLAVIPALEASLILLVEPVLNPVWAWLVHGERPGPWAVAGGAVILGATTIKSWLDARGGAPVTPAAEPALESK